MQYQGYLSENHHEFNVNNVNLSENKKESNRFDSSLPVEIIPRKKHFPSTDIYKDWNYLEGAGPSSSKVINYLPLKYY